MASQSQCRPALCTTARHVRTTHGEPTLLEYAEDETRPCATVYGWVPARVIDAIVESHGGINHEFPGMRFVLERIRHAQTIDAYPKRSWEVPEDDN